jgi:hypothetical protein
VDNIEMDLEEIECGKKSNGWIDLAQNRDY